MTVRLNLQEETAHTLTLSYTYCRENVECVVKEHEGPLHFSGPTRE